MQTTDEEHVARLRRSVERLDRVRPWLLALWLLEASAWLGSMIVYVAMLSSWIKRGPRDGDPLPSAWFAAVVGLSSGLTLGFLAAHLGVGLAMLLHGRRNERLLLRYHDELAVLLGDKPGTDGDDVGGSSGPRTDGTSLECGDGYAIRA